MGIMKIVWRTDAQVIGTRFIPTASQFFQIAIEPFYFREKSGVGKISVQNSNRIMGIRRGQQMATDVMNCLQVPGSDKPSGTDHRKVFGFHINVVFHLSASPRQPMNSTEYTRDGI